MSTLYTQPDPYALNKDKEWYKRNVQFIGTQYNKPSRLKRTSPHNQGKNSINGGGGPKQESMVDEIMRMLTYYLGRQENSTYYYTTVDESNCDLPNVWIAGQKVTSLVDFMVGKFVEIAENISPSVKTTSQAAHNRKTELLERLLLKIYAPELFGDMSSYGVEFNPLGGSEAQLENEDQVYRFMEFDYKEQAEILCTKLCEDIINRNKAKNIYKKAFFFTLLGGYVGIENYIENGKSYFKMHKPQNLIVDNTHDDDLHENDRFVGVIEWMTTEQILSKWGSQLTEEEKSQIKKITPGNANDVLGIAGLNFPWFFDHNGFPMLGVLKGKWKACKDLGYEKSTDRYGTTHMKKVRKVRKTPYDTEMVYTATLIGNKYVVDEGEDTNQVRSMQNPSNVELPIHIFMPNMLEGECRSIVSRLHNHQDRIDFLVNEITKMVTRSKGKTYIVNGHKLGSATSKELLNDLTRAGIHVTDGAVTGEDFIPGDNDKMIEVVDMTLDPNIQLLSNLRREEERIMEEIVNIPKIALGQQTSYVGAKTQAGTIQQSTLGTAQLYQGFMSFVEKVLRHGVNQYKLVAVNESETQIPVIGTRGVEYLKATKDIQWEELGVYLKIRDFIDEQARERLLFNAQAMAQNGLIDMLDLLQIEKCTTYSELMSELEFSLKRKERKAEQQQALMQMMAQAQQDQQMQSKASVEQAKQQGANYRQELKVGSELAAQNTV